MPRMHFGLGGVALGVAGTVAVLMFIPAGNADTQPRPSALSTSPELSTFLEKSVYPRPAEKTSEQVIAEVAAAPEPGQPAPVQNLALPSAPATVAATTQTPTPATVSVGSTTAATGPRELVAVRSAVNMRAGPSTRNPTLFVLNPDEQVAVLERQGGWVRIEKSNGATGWVYSRYLGDGSGSDDVDTTVTGSIEPSAAPKPRVEKPRVEKPIREARIEQRRNRDAGLASIRLRAAPSRGAETIFTVEPGTPLRVAERRNGWARVVVPGGMSGWVRVQ
jgi:SH3-like domain-containing protein